MVCSEANSYTPKILTSSSQFDCLARIKTKLSSAKNKCVTIGAKHETLNPLNKSLSYVVLINADKPSAHKIKRKWDNGSPCLMPLSGVKLPYCLPLIRKDHIKFYYLFKGLYAHVVLKLYSLYHLVPKLQNNLFWFPN